VDLLLANTRHGGERSLAKARAPIGQLVDERCIVNAMVALLATGGSTNHLIHWIAVARAAGILIDWDDFSTLSDVVPLLSRVYPNGSADVNQFEAAGGPAFVIGQLLEAGLMHADVLTLDPKGLARYGCQPSLLDGQLVWHKTVVSGDDAILRPAERPFSPTGGLKLLKGPLGRAVIKTSAVPQSQQVIRAPAMVFDSQEALLGAFADNTLHAACHAHGGIVCVVRWQGPRANGMPELHKLTPALAVLQNLGFNVALVTDGRMSGASGKVPAAIHVSPEAAMGGPLARVRNGDLLELNAPEGALTILDCPHFDTRPLAQLPATLAEHNSMGLGRGLFKNMRHHCSTAEEGACSW
jgi:phosphogluconate dehydratase